jgi:hypothetical protein
MNNVDSGPGETKSHPGASTILPLHVRFLFHWRPPAPSQDFGLICIYDH